jgi:hypothetical protein
MPTWLTSDLIFWAAITIIVVVPVIGTFWYKFHKANLDFELKRHMIERGMAAEEIERVLRAGAEPEEEQAEKKA